MKYLKRLKKELADLSEKLTPKGVLPEYVRVMDLNRKSVLPILIEMLRRVRAIDQATDNWSPGNADEWLDFLRQLDSWSAEMPTPPKEVEKSEAAA